MTTSQPIQGHVQVEKASPCKQLSLAFKNLITQTPNKAGGKFKFAFNL